MQAVLTPFAPVLFDLAFTDGQVWPVGHLFTCWDRLEAGWVTHPAWSRVAAYRDRPFRYFQSVLEGPGAIVELRYRRVVSSAAEHSSHSSSSSSFPKPRGSRLARLSFATYSRLSFAGFLALGSAADVIGVIKGQSARYKNEKICQGGRMTDGQAKRAEADLLEMLRGRDGESFRLVVTCEHGNWQVVLEDLDQQAAYAVGEGKSFAEAWSKPSRKASSKG